MNAVLRAASLEKRYGRTWALRDCSLDLPTGRVAALVGPNGAGKTTLLQLAIGLTEPTGGAIEVLGWSPQRQPELVLPRVGFLAQDRPLYRSFTVSEMLTMGRKLNARFDESFARARLQRLAIPLNRKVGKLSGGQQAQVALVLALAKRPELLLLDEPVSALDPLARREFLQTLMEAVAENGLTVLLSSHIIADLERVCDFLIILSGARVQLAGDIEELVGRHKLLVGPRSEPDAIAHLHNVIQVDHTPRQTTLLVRTNGQVWDSSWQVHDVALEEIVLAYLGQSYERPEADVVVREEAPV